MRRHLLKVPRYLMDLNPWIQLLAGLATIVIALGSVVFLIVPRSDDGRAQVTPQESGEPLVFTTIGSDSRLVNVVGSEVREPDGSQLVAEAAGNLAVTCAWIDSIASQRHFEIEPLSVAGFQTTVGFEQSSAVVIRFDVSSVSPDATVVIERLTSEVVVFKPVIPNLMPAFRACARGGASPPQLPDAYAGQLDPNGETDLVLLVERPSGTPQPAEEQPLYVLDPHDVALFKAKISPIREGTYEFRINIYYHTSGGVSGRTTSPGFRLVHAETLAGPLLYPYRAAE